MPKIYTKTGDRGTTSLYCGKRLEKSEHIFDVLGEVDELSSRIGVVFPYLNNQSWLKEQLREIQQDLQDINSIIATNNPVKRRKLREITEKDVERLETWIDECDKLLPRLTTFILPGNNFSDSHTHMCRTQTRKVERFLWRLHRQFVVDENEDNINILLSVILKYINRLSDYFFTIGRYLS